MVLQGAAGETMARPILDIGLWQTIEPFLPPPKKRRRRHPGRKPLDQRRIFAGILFVLKTGMTWKDLPQELGFGSGMTCWRHLRDWHQAGVFQKAFRALLDRLNAQGKIDWSRGGVDSSSVRAVFGGRRPARIRRTGVKRAQNTIF
jgi:transposase